MSKRQRKIEEVTQELGVKSSLPVHPPQWLTSSMGEVIEITLERELLLLIQLEGENSESKAAVISESAWNEFSKQVSSFENWVLGDVSSPAVRSRISFRLFGAARFLNDIEATLRGLRLKPGKHLTIPEGASLQFIPREGRIRIEKKALLALSLLPGYKSGVRTLAVEESEESKKVRVLVVDDSATIRKLLSRVISEDSGCECVGAVGSPRDVEKAIQELKPDVLTLDIHMPEIDGVTLVKKLFPKYRLPILMISSLAIDDGSYVLDALAAGAVDYIQKPTAGRLQEFRPNIIEKIKGVSRAQLFSPGGKLTKNRSHAGKAVACDPEYIVLLGASTGGTEAIREVLISLPAHTPPILIVQHIPAGFSKAFAERMDEQCPFAVKEAKDGDLILPSRVLIAPGGKQMRVREMNGERRVVIDDSEPINRHRPSVDALFESVAELNHPKVVAALLTGMGSDGARGLLKLKGMGAVTFAQDQQSCVVFGMPREAIKIGAAKEVVPLDQMGNAIANVFSKGSN